MPIKSEKRRKYFIENHMNQEQWPKMKEKIARYFLKYPSLYWENKFRGTDACVQRVLKPHQAFTS